jgi:hypothetical protein
VVSLRLPWLWRCWTSSTAARFDAPFVEHSWANEPRPGTYVAPEDLPSMIAKTPGRSRFSVRVRPGVSAGASVTAAKMRS